MKSVVSVSRFRRDPSATLARVTQQGERILLTFRGKPMAALVSMDNYERLLRSESRTSNVQKWLAETRALSGKIEKRRGGPVDVDAILDAARQELDAI